MNTSRLKSNRGSAFATTIIIVGVLAVLTASMLSYSVSERRANEHHRLVLRARNAAENVSVYAAEQLTTKLYRLRSTTAMAFMTGDNQIKPPPFTPANADYSIPDQIVPSSIEVRAALTTASGMVYVDPADPANAGNPNIGLQVNTAQVPIISKATATRFSAGTYTSYIQQDMEVALIPLFQFGIFYNMDLEFFPGQDMSIGGPVHTNGRLLARGEVGGDAILTFGARVTAAAGLYADGQLKVLYRNRAGANTAGAGGTGAVNFTPVGSTTLKNLYGDSKWRDHKFGGTTETATTLNQFKGFATSTYLGNLRTNVHGVTKLELPSIGTYKEQDDLSTAADERNNGREIIESPNPRKYISGTWTDTTDSADIKPAKLSRNVGLYIMVNPDDTARTSRLPNETAVQIPGRGYRAWLSTINTDSSISLREVILPGQPSYWTGNERPNETPNAYRTDTSVGHNQILRIPKGTGVEFADTGYDGANVPTFPALTDAYFYDLRRANGNRGYPYNRGTYNYTPRPVAKIDFDLTRFKMMIDRTLYSNTTSSIFNPSRPSNSTWGSSIFNSATSVAQASYGLGIGSDYNTFPSADPVDMIPWTQAANIGQTTNARNLVIKSFAQTGAGTITDSPVRILISYTTDPRQADAPSTAWSHETFPIIDQTSITYTPRLEATATRIRIYKAGTALATGAGGVVDKVLTNVADLAILAITGGTLLDEQMILHVPDMSPLGVGSDSNTRLRRYRISETTAVAGSAPTATPATFATATWTTRYTSGTDESFLRYTPTSTSVTAVRVEEFPAGSAPAGVATVTKINPEYNMTLSNDYFGIPSNALGGALLLTNAFTDIRVYEGGVDDTANWTFSYNSPSGSCTGGFGKTSGSISATGSYTNGPGYNRFWLNGMSALVTVTTGQVRLRATKGTITIDRTFSVAKSGMGLGATANTNRWLTVTHAVSVDPFKMYFAQTNPADAPVEVAASDLINTASPSPWFDGITVYINSLDAERRAQSSGVPDRVDSGVRFWNGRGSLPSLTVENRTGSTFVTNDAAYIVGHFNADGKNLDSVVTSTSYSGRYPDGTSEKLACVMADAITILSQPTFNTSYVQINGWNDALSGNRIETSGWSTNWRTTTPSSSNSYEGSGDTVSVRNMPNLVNSGLEVITRNQKFDPVSTEISAAMLMGLVPSNHNPTGLTDSTGRPSDVANQQYSGGAHNFPRLLEPWNSYGLYIRGSMVALFESRVAMEPWNLRVYSAPDRFWGLHENLRTAGHDVPLEPVVLNAQRKRYREINKTEYDSKKTAIEALPHE